ncbi:response regulator transcription factor [Paraburkholderia sp. DHOC27]|uniref:response regulator transcription factor n=1 Tax=Paraburkholderia sp. DHOC27 TaxID=2303330 RepID=UPI000E3E7453|nr:response regulator transcription factor [Paraburkholderia sp. DHOC27]RFU48757.1 DNA-binding response regulator [Paraburkholderia sp. DHOC27]
MATILIVDDHPALRLVIKTHLLQLLGVTEVIEAENGQAAMEAARQHMPDLAILDLDIPRVNGLDVIPRLKMAHPQIRVLILSGQDPSTFAPRAMRSGAQGFVGKSQEMKEIMRGVEAVLAGYTVFPMSTGGAGVGMATGAADEEEKLKQLSDKELMILQMLSKGMSNKAIGDALFISDKTVSTYKSRIQEKLGLSSLAALIEFASLQKLID